MPLALFSALWLNLARQLSFQWSTKEQYAFGWFVPLLALCLFWRRWTTRPECHPVTPPRWVVVLVCAAAGMLLPVQIVCEANPDWPLSGWLIALLVVGLSLYGILLAGGWRWVLLFAFPVGFILIAVSWPYRIEHGITHGLMKMVAGLTVSVLGWFDVISSQRGNLIDLSTGAVGIDEACSGIRSFQSTMMGALFLGELYLLSWRRRLAVLAGGVLLAVCFNVVRTLILTWWASETGVDALKKWHDPAGFSIFGATFACLWLLAWRLRKNKVQSPLQPSGFSPHPLASSLQVSGFSPQPSSSAFRYLLVLGCWSVCFVALSELWYVAHERAEKPPQRWYASLPATNSTFQTVELTPQVLETLRNDENISGTWRQQDGMDWTVFFLRWNPKSVPSVIRARSHRPDVCLPGAGFWEISNLPIEYFEAGPLKLPFQRYTYEANRQLLYVFFCLWQDGDEDQRGMRMRKGLRVLGVPERVQLAWQGKRRLGQQTLEIVVSGCESFQKAEQQVRTHLPGMIRLGQAGYRMAQNTQ